MRVRQLSLDRFGQFAGKVFDFGDAGRDSDFHVIYGSNETGKTTTMEGFLRLLFGFDHQEDYDFRHQRKNLKISGVLDIDGEEKTFVRLPTRVGNLLDESGTPVPDTAILAHLGGLKMSSYRNLLCLDDRTIEEGGDAIAKAKGDIGRLLFSAAAGIADLTSVLNVAQDKITDLHLKGGSKSHMAKLKREKSEVESQINEADVTIDDWRKLKAAAKLAGDKESEARIARDALLDRKAETEAQRRALPNLEERDHILGQISKFADYPERLDISSSDLVALSKEHGRADAEKERLVKEIDEAEMERGGIELNEGLLALSKKIKSLDNSYSRAWTAFQDLPTRKGTLQKVEGDMARIAAELSATGGTESVFLVKPLATIVALEKCWKAVDSAKADYRLEEREVSDLRERVDKAQAKVDESSSESDGPPSGNPPGKRVGDLLRRYEVELLVSSVSAARTAIEGAQSRFHEALGKLCVGNKTFDSLPNCSVSLASVEVLANRYEALTNAIDNANRELAKHSEDASASNAKIISLKVRAGRNEIDDLDLARVTRDHLWDGYQQAPTPEGANKLTDAIMHADEVSDSCFANARELAQLKDAMFENTDATAREKSKRKQLEKLKKDLSKIETRVKKVTKALKLSISEPAALLSWMNLYDVAAKAQRDLSRVEAQHKKTLNKAEKLLEALQPLIHLEDPNFEEAVSAARRLSERERKLQEKATSAKDQLSVLKDDLKRREVKLRKLYKYADDASNRWNKMVADSFSDVLDSETLGNSLSLLHELREHDGRRRHTEQQIIAMERDWNDFSKKIKGLADAHGIDKMDPIEAFDLLANVARKATSDFENHSRLDKEIEDCRQKLKDAEHLLAEIDKQREQFSAYFPKEAKTKTLEDLLGTVGEAEAIIREREKIDNLERRICSDLSVQNIEDARNQLDGKTVAGLDAKIDKIKIDLVQADDELSLASKESGACKERLMGLIGDGEVALLDERKTTIELEIEETAEEYLRRFYGFSLAEEALRRYRDKHRSEMMYATERAFKELTNGAYTRLATESGGKNESEVLKAADSDGTFKSVEDLSKGTRFQLYLALRAAAYEEMSGRSISLPFFCDDVFETFDDERTKAACRLMERIGRHGQAIYLTHHHHVVEIAREVCKTAPTVHML